MKTLTGQLMFDLEPSQAGIVDILTATATGRYWRAWSLDTPRAQAVAAFRERYGQDPQCSTESRGLLLVGPVPGR
jgi:hypothetical protein